MPRMLGHGLADVRANVLESLRESELTFELGGRPERDREKSYQLAIATPTASLRDVRYNGYSSTSHLLNQAPPLVRGQCARQAVNRHRQLLCLVEHAQTRRALHG